VTAAAVAYAAASAVSAAEWRRITGPPELIFPRDHGAHPDYRTEWWYATGLVADDDGKRYGFQITIFRQGLDPTTAQIGSSGLRARQILAAHLAVVDVDRQLFRHAERLRRAAGGLAGFSTDGLDLWLDDWVMKQEADGSIRVRARDGENGIGLDLALRNTRGLVAHGDGGYSQKGAEPGNASAYLSWTRMAVAGKVEVAGRSREVTGASWFDHEWGSSQLGADVVGWDWFSLRLDDGRDLMLYRLRREDGSADRFSSGSLVDAVGDVTRLGADDFTIVAIDHWTSPDSGGRYPSGWRLRVPRLSVNLELRPLFRAAEVDGSRSTGVVYWEGPVEVIGSATGEGYAELTGYAGTLDRLF
jgi:predicted secreted hydrolase